MTPQQIVGMAARLFAIWLVVIAFQLFGVATALMAQVGESAGSAFYFMPVLPLLIAIFLWLFPMLVAHRLVPRTNDANKLRIPVRELTAAASAIIGIWVLIAAVPLLVGTAGIAFFSDENMLREMYFTPERKLQLLGVLLQCGFALFLVFRPWVVARKVFAGSEKVAAPSAGE